MSAVQRQNALPGCRYPNHGRGMSSMYWNYCNENCEYLSKDHKCKADGKIVTATLTVHGGCVSWRYKHVGKCVKDREAEANGES